MASDPVTDVSIRTAGSSSTGTVIGVVAGIVVVLAGLAGFLYARRCKA